LKLTQFNLSFNYYKTTKTFTVHRHIGVECSISRPGKFKHKRYAYYGLQNRLKIICSLDIVHAIGVVCCASWLNPFEKNIFVLLRNSPFWCKLFSFHLFFCLYSFYQLWQWDKLILSKR